MWGCRLRRLWGAVPSVEILSAYLIDDFHLCLGKARATQQSAGEVGAGGGGTLSGAALEGGAESVMGESNSGRERLGAGRDDVNGTGRRS